MQKTNLNELVKNVIDVLSISLKDTKVDIRIGPTCNSMRIQISEVFSNLISNAIKYNDKAEKSVEIGFDNIGWPILDLELDDSRIKNFLRPRIRLIIKNQKSKSKTEEQAVVFMYEITELGFAKIPDTFRIFKRLHASNKYGVERVLG